MDSGARKCNNVSKANQRRLDCLHEAGHAVMAWIQGVTIIEIRLVPDHEAGELAATTSTKLPGPTWEHWSLDDVIAQMRIVLAGPRAEQLGPAPMSAGEREFVKQERNKHLLKAMQYAKQFGGSRIQDALIPRLAASAEKDVDEVFNRTVVVQSVRALASELLGRESILGPDAEAFIASKITEQQRNALQECCVTKPRARATSASAASETQSDEHQ